MGENEVEIRFDYEPLPEGAQFLGFCTPWWSALKKWHLPGSSP